MMKPNNLKSYKKPMIGILLTVSLGFMLVIWFTFLYDFLQDKLDVWELFIIFYVVIMAMWGSLFITIFGIKVKALRSIVVFTTISAMIDIVVFPYNVLMDGSVASSNAPGMKSSIDYFFGYYINQIGIHGIFVFIIVYFLLPLIILMVLLFSLGAKKFISAMNTSSK